MIRRAMTSALVLAGTLLQASPLSAQQAPDEAGFVLLRGTDTIVVERFTRTEAGFEGELTTRVPASRTTYAATVAPNALVPEVEFAVDSPPRGGEPDVRATVEFAGDSAHARVEGPGASPEQHFAPGAGALPYLNLSTAFLEQIVRRAREVGVGHTVPVPLLALGNGQSFTVSVASRGPDSTTIILPPGIEIHLAVDASGRVLGGSVPAQGITIERVESVDEAALAPPPPADYSAPADAPYGAEEVRVPTPAGHVLAGTLTLPENAESPLPAVVLVSGSGPQDRDEALPGLPGYRPFREIADTLSRSGIAVLRLDDRGVGESTGEFSTATSADFAEDVRAAVAYLRQREEIDPTRIGLVGHSEGGLIAPMVAAEDPELAAVALLAAPAQSGREILRYQLRFAARRDPSLSTAARDSVLGTVEAQIDSLAAAQPWMRYFAEYDPLPTARRVDVPVLILQGATDQQITADQAAMLAAAIRAGGNPNVEVHVLRDVNHLFLTDPVGDFTRYADLTDRNVVPKALGTLADWLMTQLR